MNKVIISIFSLFVAMAVTSCATDVDSGFDATDHRYVEFGGRFGGQTRATETSFEYGDAISLFAVDPSVSDELYAQNNYADNVKYTFDGSGFKAGTDGVVIGGGNTTGYAYYAVYPYTSSAADSFYFTVKSNQSTWANYTASDLCTAYHTPTAAQYVDLVFNHKLVNVAVVFSGNNIASKSIDVKLEDFYAKSLVDLNSDLCYASGYSSDITMYEPYTNEFCAIVAPQTRYAGEKVMTVTIDGTSYGLSLAERVEFNSGYEVVFYLHITRNSISDKSGKITTCYL